MREIVTGTIGLEDYPILEDFDLLDRRIKQDNNCNKNFYNHIATWYGLVDYAYTGVRHKAQNLPTEFAAIARDLEDELEYRNGYFNSLLINSYTNKGLAAHSDNEPIFRRKDGTIGAVATISLGGSAEVKFTKTNRYEFDAGETFEADHGSLYVMPDGNFQHRYKHAVSKCVEPRISLTFRHTTS